MARKEPYGVKKDLKILKGSSNKHTARLEGQFLGIVPVSELEVDTENSHKKGRGILVKGVKNPLLKIDLKVGDLSHKGGPLSEMLHLVGLGPREADFEVLVTMDKVLRALAKARFRNLEELRFNGELVYDHPEEEWDLRKVLKELGDLAPESKLDDAEAKVVIGDEGNTEASVKIDRTHTALTHDILIRFEGELDGEMLRRVINYIEEHLEIDELIQA